MHTPQTRKADAQKQKEKYHAAKAAGICPHCEQRPNYEGMVSCLVCRGRHRRYARLFNSRQRALRRQGLLKEPDHAAAEP